MKRILGTTVALAVLAIFLSSAQAAINIDQATIQNGQVFIAGDQAQRRQPISWEGVALGINSTNGGAFTFNTTNLPADCVGRLKIGTEARDVVIENCEPTTAGVPQTGQTPTVPINPAPAGSDGALQKGVAWPNPRFTDNGNGTVTDNLTGLIWLKKANCMGVVDDGPINDSDGTANDGRVVWQTALNFANMLESGDCGLTDGSVVGDWRLPNVRELQSLVDYGFSNPARSNVAGTGKAGSPDDPFTNFQSSYYWSSTTFADSTFFAWLVDFFFGNVFLFNKSIDEFVTAVRGGS